MPFKPGQSGNPGGRPKIAKEIRLKAQEASKEALEVLLGIMRDGEKASERAAAARTVLQLGGMPFSEEAATPEAQAPAVVAPVPDEELASIAAQGEA